MNITSYVTSERESALLVGDYNVYRAQATRRIHSLRKRLGQTTPKGRKYIPKAPVTADDIQRDHEFVNLLLMSAERAWAAAMAMKKAQSTENTQRRMPGSTKRQIYSRLSKAIQYAEHLQKCLQYKVLSCVSDTDNLEAAAYLASMRGALHFEKARWEPCIREYSVARVIYATLGSASRLDLFKDLLSNTVDPSIRYAAYQLRYSRTKAVSDIAIEGFPQGKSELLGQIKGLNPDALLTSEEAEAKGQKASYDTPSTINWRGRTVKIEDATIAQAIESANRKERELAKLHANGQSDVRELTAAYDDVINARQEAVDATKTAIEELMSEGVDTSDTRVQSLQLTRTAVNYAVIELMVGRNRNLCGQHDGAAFERTFSKRSRKPRKDGTNRVLREESTSVQVAKLRERVALYDSILQSIDAVGDLLGVAGDLSFMEELSSKRAYFRALKCLTIGRRYAILGELRNALALYARSLELTNSVLSTQSIEETEASDGLSKLDVKSKDLQRFHGLIEGTVSQYRALVELKDLMDQQKASAKDIYVPPLVERLGEYPAEDIDLMKLVNFPPKLQPIPVKPLFFDLAWNYIDYPGRGTSGVNVAPAAPETAAEVKKEPAKKGWFGFGR
ncbi:hypothetical protein GJ744_008003 [Endocarpon pusillum]|uniref:Signal recognition particle subunit SRP68 n=1 Tax=Endocarpon pusillum TaxID=364733 RepID=A0A8H7E5P8_9EURO|nr:hypothetical protein GJ744_008003 [Endocarpon pusillum]